MPGWQWGFRLGLISITAVLVFPASGLAGWVESGQVGMVIRHPPGWKVSWHGHRVIVSHPFDSRIWCALAVDPWTGSARLFVDRAIASLRTRYPRVRMVGRAQVSTPPDTYGARVIYRSGGVLQGMLLLSTATGRGRVITRSYGAPAAVYDRWKLLLIPILLSFHLNPAGPSGRVVIRSAQGYWFFRAPAGWTAPALGRDEPFRPKIIGPAAQAVGVYNFLGQLLWATYLGEYYRRRGVNVRRSPQTYMRFIYQTHIPFLSATDLLRRVVLPSYGLGMKALRIVWLKPLAAHTARYRISFVDQPTGRRFIEEGVIRNSSVTNPQGGDLNPFIMFWVRAPAASFDSVRGSLWRIVQSFQPAAQFEQALIALIARVRRENVRAMHNVVMARIRSNRRMLRQTMRTTMQVMRDHRQARRGWAWALADSQVVRDPRTGQQYVVPAGGEYIYVRPSGGGDVDVIRSNGPMLPGELPLGFRRFEQVPLARISQ